MAKDKLSVRMRKFAAVYDGNGTAAAELAGYKGSRATLAQQAYRLLRRADVRELIVAREEGQFDRFTLTRDERLELLSAVAVDPDEKTRDRLKALDQLCRAFGDYTEKLEVKVSGSFSELLKKARQRAQRR